MIDLHTHTRASDGTDTPAELISAAARRGIRALAVTDHDTTAGWDEAATAVRALLTPFTLVRGAEFSCVHQTPDGQRISLHLLGYLFDPDSEALRTQRIRLRESRLSRGAAIVDNLVEAGYPISWPQVLDIARGGSVGRPHIGQALIDAGVVSSVSEAFAQMLSSSSPYYVPKQDMPVMTAIELIRQAGGVPVIAHPWARRRGKVVDEQALAAMIDEGMLGLEVDHPDHDRPDRERLRELAARWGVLCTGSSDYHGANKAAALGDESTSQEDFERLLSSASGIEAIRSARR